MSTGHNIADRIEPLVITRFFAAPRELVWRAWTEADRIVRWWGPIDFSASRCELDLRPGGFFRITMHGPNGGEIPVEGIFEEVAEPIRLVLTTTGFPDAAGIPMLRVRHTVGFEERGDRTELTVRAEVLHATREVEFALAGMEEGLRGSLDKLRIHVEAPAR